MTSSNIITRDGVEVEKGIVLTKQMVEDNQEVLQQWLETWLAYPDLFIDMITPADSNFCLFFYQRIFMRVCMRFRYVYATFTRAFSKSFIAILTSLVQCVLLPGRKFFICADVKAQAIKIATEKVNEIFGLFPLLEREIMPGGKNMSNDYITLKFRNGSIFDVVGVANSTRGGRRHGGLIEEVGTMDEGDTLNETVLPLMNISRRDARGNVLEGEPNQQQVYVTTAGSKASFAYEKLIELLIMSVIKPNSAFIWGGDYRIPVMYGLLDKDYIDEIKLSSTYKEDSFAREYMSVWSGSGSDSWINIDKLMKHRKLINAHLRAKSFGGNTDGFYLISVDVGRFGDLTAIIVFRVLPQEYSFTKQVVNIIVLDNVPFPQQAVIIKRLYSDFQPREIVIDANGLGAGLVDLLITDNIDHETGVIWAPLGVLNDDRYLSIQPRNCDKVIYALKATPKDNSEMYGNMFVQLNSGKVEFLAHERIVREKLLATKIGQKMNLNQRAERLMPYEMTSRLFDELGNLRVKPNPAGIQIERISSRVPKDRVSALNYGLARIQYFEQEYYKKKNRKSRPLAHLAFYEEGNTGINRHKLTPRHSTPGNNRRR